MSVRKLAAAVVINNEKILLIKRKYEPFKETWCAPGGFTGKNDEKVEDCAVRETKEETNIDIEI